MTKTRPPRFQRKNHGTSHSYTLDGQLVPGVTTICGVLDKPALVTWAARETAAYADDNWARLSEMRSADRIAALEKARFQTNRKATTKGTRIHAMAEQLAHGKEVTVPVEIRPQVEAVARFLDQWEWETVVTESPVANTSYRYAGTADAVLHNDRFGNVLLDWKTGKGIYDEVALQLAAYKNCDLRLEEQTTIGPRGGKKTEWVEAAMPQIDQCMVAHVHEESIELHPVVTDDSVFTMFLYELELLEGWVKRTSWRYRSDDSFSPTIGDPIWPETGDPE